MGFLLHPQTFGSTVHSQLRVQFGSLDGFVFFLNESFIEVKSTHCKIRPFKVYSSEACSIFMLLCNH